MSARPENPLRALTGLGQSIWLDYIERRILEDGTLGRMIREDGVSGMTSNPAIFEKAIAHTDDYRAAIVELANRGAGPEELYERLAIYDVRKACDLFRDLYEQHDGTDGFVSLEVSPLLAHDTDATVAEARRLWKLVERPNIMIKVPATREGLPAIRTLIRDGLNINVTLLFSVGRYVQVVDAYMGGLEDRLTAGQPVNHTASVASFFLSRIDTKVDALLDDIAAGDGEHSEEARALRGQAATASAGEAYRRFEEHFGGDRWRRLADHGARRQRLLWASTSTKDPAYSDVKYVEPLIGPYTVNTVPTDTLNAYRDHGNPEPRLHETCSQAPQLLKRLTAVGIDLRQVDEALEAEGVTKFVNPFKQLLETLDAMRQHKRSHMA
ncbi:MAG: transaldolase [Gammaproteobacteria bacterium]